MSSDLKQLADVLNSSVLAKTSEAPTDGKQYARKDGAWVEVVAGGAFSGDMDDIPNGTTYVKTENNLTDALVSTIGSALQSETSHADVLVDADIGVTVQGYGTFLEWDGDSNTDHPTLTTKHILIGRQSAAITGEIQFTSIQSNKEIILMVIAITASETVTLINEDNNFIYNGVNTSTIALTDADNGKVLRFYFSADYGKILVTGVYPSGGSADDTAYDATTWDGNTDAPTKNAVRDKLETLVANTNKFSGGHIFGLGMSNAADTANDITVAVGEARCEGNACDLVLASAITKQLDAAWSVGTNAGGLNTGAKADSTWYEVILIKRVDTGVVDVMFSTTANRATLPANYTAFRRIGWIRTDAGGTGIKQFSQRDDDFTWVTQVNDVATTKATAAAAVTLTVPPYCIARFRATADMSTSVNANSVIVFSEIVEGDVTPAMATGIGSLGYWDLATGVSAGHFELRVSSTSTIEHDSSVQVANFDISTFGYRDSRCRLSNY